MTTSTNPVALQAAISKAGSSLTIHASRGKTLGTPDRPNFRTLNMVTRYDLLRRQAIEAACWESYCHAVGACPTHTGVDFFA